MKILGVGIATLDIVNTVASYPDEDDEVRAISRKMVRGGNVTNSLNVLSQLGHACAWAGMLADDHSSKFVLKELDSCHIDHKLAITAANAELPVSYITLNAQNGSRTIVHYRNLEEYSSEHFFNIDYQTFDWIHFEGRNVVELKKMCEHLVSSGFTRFSIEVEKHREGLEDVFSYPQIIMFSRAYVHESHESVKAFFETLRDKGINADLYCAWGKAGGWAMSKNNQLYQQPAFQPDQVVDTLGAGDVFNAGVLHASQNDQNVRDTLEFACRIAGFKCGVEGLTAIGERFKP
jgi:ketohexokinase